MYFLRDGKQPRSHRRSPVPTEDLAPSRPPDVTDALGSLAQLPGIATRAATSPLPTLLDWQRTSTPKPGAHSRLHAGARRTASGGGRRRAAPHSSSPLQERPGGKKEQDSGDDGRGRLDSSALSPSRSNHSGRPGELTAILSPSSKFSGRTSPGGRTSPPGLGGASSPTVYRDAGRSNMFTGRIPQIAQRPGSATKVTQESPIRVPAPQPAPSIADSHDPARGKNLKVMRSSKQLSALHGRTSFMWGNQNSMSTLRSGTSKDGLEAIYHNSIHPCYSVMYKSWQNFDLFQEFAGGEDNPQQSILLKNLTERKDLLDFTELLDLLRSLQVLCPRGGIFNEHTQVTVTRVHEIFLEVNKLEWTAFVSSSGFLGEANMDQCTFEEYKLVMLCIAHTFGISLDIFLPGQQDLPVNRQELIDQVITLTERAHLKSIENKPGTAQFLQRCELKDGVKIAFKNVEAARQACTLEEFARARAHSQFATSVFLQSLRPDLLCEIRLVEEQITRDENTVFARKRQAQSEVEKELLRANHLSKELNVDQAKAQIAMALKMAEAARLPIKGQLRLCIKASEQFLEEATRAIQGDKKLAIAWRALQRDELKDARSAFADASELCKGLSFREAALHIFQEALDKKSEHDTERKERGRGLLQRARTKIEEKRFKDAYNIIEEARSVFMEWTIPVGKNQLLTEHLTKLFKRVWTDEELYISFCAFDLDNLSGAGSRALMMDFNELLQLFRHLGILSERQKGEVNRPETSESASAKKMPKSRLAELEKRQALVDSCTSSEIRNSEKAKISKADVYYEFRAVNQMSVTDLAGGNLEADDDMSSLDWSEYQLLITRIAKVLDVPVTDLGCSPLFARDVERVDVMQQELNVAKKDYLNGIVSTGEKFLSASRLAVQDKRFDDAIVEVHNAEAEFKRVWEEKIQKSQLANCARQLDVIEKERAREGVRRVEQKVLGEAALDRACEMLEEFDATGALFDDSKFALIEKEAIAAQKHFKSAAAFSAELKQRIVKVFALITEDKEEIIRMRQGVQNGSAMVGEARSITEDLARSFSMARIFPTLSRSSSAQSFAGGDASREPSRMSTPSLGHSPFEKPLRLLIDAKELFVKAKVQAPFQELRAAFHMLHIIAVERKGKHFKDGLTHADASRAALLSAGVAQNTDANEVDRCFEDARKKLMLAKFAFNNGSYSDLVLQYEKQHPESFMSELEVVTQDLHLPALGPAHEPQSSGKTEIPPVDSQNMCDELEDKIEDEEKAWNKKHAFEVKEAFKCIEMCHEALEKKAFHRANECFKRASDLFKHTNQDDVESMRKTLNQAEMKDRTLSKQIKGEAKAKSEQAQAALAGGQLELAVITVEEALEMCHRCDDSDLMQAAEKIKTAAVSVANETYGTVSQKMQENMAAITTASKELNFEEATSLMASCHVLLEADSLQAAIRALKHVDPFQDYPILAEELATLESETIAKERAHRTHVAFELSQGIVRIRRMEGVIACSQAADMSRDDLTRFQAQLAEIAQLIKEDAGAASRLQLLQGSVTTFVKAKEESDKKALKDAAQLQGQAETASKYNKFVDAKRFSYASQAFLIDAQSKDEDFEKAAAVAQAAEENGAKALHSKRSEFSRLTVAVFEAFDSGLGDDAGLLKALATADAARKCLARCIDEQNVLAVLEPFTVQYVEWMKWAEESALDISSFCECMQAVIHSRVLALSSLPNYDVLSLSPCPTLFQPIYAVSPFYQDSDLLSSTASLKLSLHDNVNESSGTNISPSDALMILEGNMSSPVGQISHVDDNTILSWSAMAAKARELLEVELKGDKLEAYEDDFNACDSMLEETVELMVVEGIHANEMHVAEPAMTKNDGPAPDGADAEQNSAEDAITKVEGGSSSQVQGMSDGEDIYTPVSSRPASSRPDTPAVAPGKDWVSKEQMQSFRNHISFSPEEMIERLNEAVLAHDFTVASAILSGGVDVDMILPLPLTDFEEETLLLRTVRQPDGSIEVVRFLLEHGACSDKTNELKRNVMHLAAVGDRVDVMEEVVACVAARDYDTEKNGFLDLSAIDEQLKALLESVDADGKTPLMIALDMKHVKAATTLVLLGADTWELGDDGMNCLHRAIFLGNEDILEVLLGSTKDVDFKTATGRSSLMLACDFGKDKMVEMLLASGANVEFCDPNGRTALHISAEAGNESLVRILLDNGSEADAVDEFGVTPAFCCLVKGHETCLKTLLDNGSDPNRKVGGHSMLYAAACLGNEGLVRLMIDSSCDLFCASESGFMPLHAAICNGHSGVTGLIADAHASASDSQQNYARIFRIAQCLAVLGNHFDSLVMLHKFEPTAQPLLPNDISSSWNAHKLATLLGRVDYLQHLKGEASLPIEAAVATAGEDNKRDAVHEAALELPRTQYVSSHGTNRAVTEIMSMLFSQEGTVLDFASLCSRECLNVVKEYHTGEVLVSVASFDQIVKELSGVVEVPERTPSESSQHSSGTVGADGGDAQDETHLDIVELEEEAIRHCFPLPSFARLKIDAATLHLGKTSPGGSPKYKRLSSAVIEAVEASAPELPEDIESRLRAEDEELLATISSAQDRVLQTRRQTAASMRVLLKRAMWASMEGDETVAFNCLEKAEACFGQCSVCLRIRRLKSGFLEHFAMCKVCNLTQSLHTYHRHSLVYTLFEYNLKEADKCLSQPDSDGAAHALKLAKKWLDNIVSDSSRDESAAIDKDSIQARWQKLEDRYIMAEITAQTEVMITEVLARDVSRRAKIALDNFCQNMMALATQVAHLVETFSNGGVTLADIGPLIENVRCARIAFMKADELVSKDDHLALTRIAYIVQGVARTLHAMSLLKDASNKLESIDGFSLRMARRSTFEAQGLCAVSREEFKMLQNSPRPQSAAGSCSSASAVALRKSRTISDVGLMQEMDSLGPTYIEACSQALEQMQSQADNILQAAGKLESALMERKMKAALSDVSRRVEREATEADNAAIIMQMAELENRAKQQCETSEYSQCLATIAEWRCLSQESILPSDKIEASLEILNLEDRVIDLRKGQVDAEASLTQALEVLASDALQAEDIFADAQAKFKGVCEQRPSMLKKIAHASQKILYAVFKALLEDEILPAALKSSENTSFEAAENDLITCLYESQQLFDNGNFAECVARLDECWSGFQARVSQLAGVFDQTNTEQEVTDLREAATMAIRQDASSARAEEALTRSRDLYDGSNFDEARDALAIAKEFSEAAGSRVRHVVASGVDAFAHQLDYDEIASVVELAICHLEKAHDAETSDKIQESVGAALAAVTAELSALCSAEAAVVPTHEKLDQLVDLLNESVNQALESAASFVHATGQEVLWAAAAALSAECGHLSVCAQARGGADHCLTAIRAYQNRVSKKLPLKEIEFARSLLQSADESVPTNGYSPSYHFPNTCGIRIEVIRSLLSQCDEEAEKCIDYTKACIVESQDKLAIAIEKVLVGDYEATERLVGEIVALDMVMSPAFWRRSKEVEAAARTSRRLAELDMLAKQEHADALRLMQDQSFDAARDMAAKCLNTKRLLENEAALNSCLLEKLKAAHPVVVPVEMPPEEPALSMDLHASSEGDAAEEGGSGTDAVSRSSNAPSRLRSDESAMQ